MNCDPKSLSGEYWVEIEENQDGWAGWDIAGAREELRDSWNCRNRLAAPNWPPGATPVMHYALIHEKHYFSYFWQNRNRPTIV